MFPRLNMLLQGQCAMDQGKLDWPKNEEAVLKLIMAGKERSSETSRSTPFKFFRVFCIIIFIEMQFCTTRYKIVLAFSSEYQTKFLCQSLSLP